MSGSEDLRAGLDRVNSLTNGLARKCRLCGEWPVLDWVIKDQEWLGAVPKRIQGSVICLQCFDLAYGPVKAEAIQVMYVTGHGGKTVAFLPASALASALARLETAENAAENEYARGWEEGRLSALAAKPSTPKPPAPEPQILTTGWPADKEPPNG